MQDTFLLLMYTSDSYAYEFQTSIINHMHIIFKSEALLAIFIITNALQYNLKNHHV